VIDPSLETEFDSFSEAYDFYNLCYWEIGFGIRYGHRLKNVAAGSKIVQEIMCGCGVSVAIVIMDLPFFMFNTRCFGFGLNMVLCMINHFQSNLREVTTYQFVVTTLLAFCSVE
jgi:hypothetical protein